VAFRGVSNMTLCYHERSPPKLHCIPNKMFNSKTQTKTYGSAFSSSELRAVLEHFSNKKEMVPPGTSRTDRSLSIAHMASMSTAEKMVSNCVLPASELNLFVGIETIFRRMSS
jgi:hypothetical protein